MRASSIGRWLSLVPLAGVAACISLIQYSLSPPGSDALGRLGPIADCATQKNLESVRHPDSVNVKLDAATWVQFMARPNGALDMVIIVNDSVPLPERPAREQAAKAKGDEVFACARDRPLQAHAAPPAPPAAPPTRHAPAAPPADGGQCVSKTAAACNSDNDCSASYNCTRGYCQGNDVGSMCAKDSQCRTYNCTSGCCQSNEPGAPCSRDNHCSSYNCTGGHCQSGEPGSLCSKAAHCKSNNCTNGKCQPNG